MSKETKACPYCGSEIPVSVKKCKYCGEWLVVQEKDKPKSSMHLSVILELLIGILSIPIGLHFGADSAIGFIIVTYIVLNLYFLPTLIADGKRTQYTVAIFALNFLLGCTGIIWIACLIWALILPDLSKNIKCMNNDDNNTKSSMQAEISNKDFQDIATQKINTLDSASKTKRCPYCAELIPINATYCSFCETSLTENLSNRIPCIDYTNTTKCVCNEENPYNIKQWNWGAFWLSWIWGIANRSFKTFWVLIPYFGFIWMFVCGAKGNEWAWQNKNWSSVNEFNNVQKKWAIVGNSIAIMLVVLFSLIFFIAVNTNDNNQPVQEQHFIEESSSENEDSYDYDYDPDPYAGVDLRTYFYEGIKIEYDANQNNMEEVAKTAEQCYKLGNKTAADLNQCVGIKLRWY